MINKYLAFAMLGCRALKVAELETDPSKLDHSIIDEFMEREEPDYGWFEIPNSARKSLHGNQIHFLNVTSQRWLNDSMVQGPGGDSVWTHHVAIVVPKSLKYTNVSSAWVTGGCNEDPEDIESNTNLDIIMADELAHTAEMISIVVFQVPNCHLVFPSDPSGAKRTEDPLLAWAFKMFHDNPEDTDTIPLLPMAKSAFQGMRAA